MRFFRDESEMSAVNSRRVDQQFRAVEGVRVESQRDRRDRASSATVGTAAFAATKTENRKPKTENRKPETDAVQRSIRFRCVALRRVR